MFAVLHPTHKALLAIQKFVGRHRYFPSRRELASVLKCSPGMAHRTIMALEQMKLLERNRNGMIISVATDVPEDTQWLSFSYPSSYERTRSRPAKRRRQGTTRKGKV